MNEAVIKDEVIEGELDFTFKNNDFAEVKPAYLLEKEVKMKPIDFIEKNISDDEFLKNVKLNPKESDSKIEKVSTGVIKLKCEICQKRMPRKLLKFIKSEEDKTVLSNIFKVSLFVDIITTYVCYSHIQMIIEGYEGKSKSPKTRYELLLRSFIKNNKYIMKDSKSGRSYCQVCHDPKHRSELYEITSKGIRMVIIFGCILRGTHSIEQAISYFTNNNGLTCYSHRKETIDMIFEHLGVGSIQEFSKCSTHAMSGLMEKKSPKKHNFTFKNGEYVEVKQEEVEQKPQYLLEQETKTESIDPFKNKNSDEFLEDVELKPGESKKPASKKPVIKEEVIEEGHNLTFINGEYVEVKQEVVEQKTENILEQEIKKEQIDLFGKNNSDDEFFEDIILKQAENQVIQSLKRKPKEAGTFLCQICQNRMPRNLVKLVISEEDKTVLSKIFKVKRFLELRATYVCSSHIQAIIDNNDGKMLPNTPSGNILRSFIRRNKHSIKHRTSQRRTCHVCHITEDKAKLYQVCSKGIRMVIMIGCILRGTHSVEQAKTYLANNIGVTCYSHCKESIDEIFGELEVRKIQELSMCSTQAMHNLMNIVKKIDSNFTVDQFIEAFSRLFMKSNNFPSNL
ncbi:unnamed protein product [Caenorhabditis nigoni]